MAIDINPVGDGPSVDPSRPIDSAKKIGMFLIGMGLFFSLLQVSQATVTPVANNLMSMVPGLQTGSSNDGPWGDF
jgi:hypothetical protein